jgi:hypothetical protein
MDNISTVISCQNKLYVYIDKNHYIFISPKLLINFSNIITTIWAVRLMIKPFFYTI